MLGFGVFLVVSLTCPERSVATSWDGLTPWFFDSSKFTQNTLSNFFKTTISFLIFVSRT